jgi:hypothetical protein
MRVLTADVHATVKISAMSSRPIRLRIGAAVYGMDEKEAIELATELANAVDECKVTDQKGSSR